MRWNDWNEDQALAKLERKGYPQFYVLNTGLGGLYGWGDIILVMLCIGRSGRPPISDYSYAIFKLAQNGTSGWPAQVAYPPR